MSEETITIIFEPDGVRAHVARGTSVQDAARRVGIALNSPCGGNGTCGNCRVTLSAGDAPETQPERENIPQEERAQGVRLSCQACPESNAVVTIPKSTHAFEQKVLVEGDAVDVEPAPAGRAAGTTRRPELQVANRWLR